MSSRFPRFGVMCMAAGVILLGIVCLILAVMLIREDWPFLTDGAQSVGRVSGNETHTEMRAGGAQPVYELRYTFEDAGQTMHTGKDAVRADIWARARPGGPLAIQYVASDPTINRIMRGSLMSVVGTLITGPVGAVFVALGIFLLVQPALRNKKVKTAKPKSQNKETEAESGQSARE
jgi:hypothetical protein